jgi:hypothetical protein
MLRKLIMEKNKKGWIISLIVLDILLVFCIVFLYIYTKNIDSNSSSPIIVEDDGHTTIYIVSHLSNKLFFYLYSLVLITIDLIILTVILVMEYIRNKKIKLKNGIIITVLSNTIITILLFQHMILFMLILNIVIIIIFLVKCLLKIKLNRII